jgi:hypothetical protein
VARALKSKPYKRACRWIATNTPPGKIDPEMEAWPETVFMLGDVFGLPYETVKADVLWEIRQRSTHAGGGS